MSALTDLRDYAATMAEIKAIEKQLDRITPTGAPSGLRAIGSSRGTNDPTSAALQRIEGMETMLQKKREELFRRAQRGERAIELFDDPKARFVMRGYYLLGMSDAQLADMLYRSRSDVQRIRKAAEAWLDTME